MRFCVGLTGGIGCGKSQAADMFASLGADVVDTDAIAHELTGPGGLAMSAIAEAFGSEYVRSDGSLDRARMRELVFSDPGAKGRLEAILHPMIRAESYRRVQGSGAPYVVLVVPLLLETGAYRDVVSRVLVVDCDESQQIARTMKRSRLTEEAVRRIMSAQLPRARRLQAADDVLSNDADIDSLRSQVETLHERYLEAAKTP
ncbi:MAG TPA: dephospho-CoA kinase [Burkholderiales bacterium]|nr:dephospho-CoA kinase [Burkholderiales bacterium]